MSEKIGGAKGTALDEEFVEMERVRITKIHNHNCDLHVFGPDWNMAALTHYHTMLHFDAIKINSCGKHCEKRRNCLKQAISPFPTMFSTLYGTYFSF